MRSFTESTYLSFVNFRVVPAFFLFVYLYYLKSSLNCLVTLFCIGTFFNAIFLSLDGDAL